MKENHNDIRSIMVSVNAINGVYALAAKKIGLKENQLSLLYALDDGKKHSQKEICEEWQIPKTTINTIVKECVADGYVTLKLEGHSREKFIYLTEAGEAFARKALNQVYEIQRRAFDKTLSAFSNEFVNELEKFAECIKEESEQYFMEH